MEELIGQLTSQLGVNADQAKGGAGLIFGLVKKKLSEGDFGKVTEALGNVDGMIEAAPEPGGAAGLLGGLASAIGGKAGGAGALASLAGGFKSLGIDADMVAKFVPIILAFAQSKGGDIVKQLLQKVLGGASEA
jgi:hypothetical protein